MALVIVRAYSPATWTAFVACSPCMGTGSIQRDKGWLTCPVCYGTGIRDMLYETVLRHGSD